MKCISGFLLVLFASFLSPTGAEDVHLYGQEGGTVTLPMEKWDSNKVYVKWTSGTRSVIKLNSFGSETIDEHWKGRVSLSKTDFSLTITNIGPDDFTSFTCELSIPSTKEYKTTTFKLHMVSTEQPASPLLAGETLTLKCNIKDMLAGTQIGWLNPKGNVQNRNALLTVWNVTGEDHGDWICVVTCQGRKAHIKAPVKVIDLSPAPPQPLYTSSSPLHLPCSFPSYISFQDLQAKNIQGGHWTFAPSQGAGSGPSGFPVNLSLEPKLSWNLNQTKNLDVPAKTTNDLDLSIKMKRVTKDDRGTYTCTFVFNKGLTLKREILVEVLHIVSSPGTNVPVGHEVNLTCNVGQPLTSDLKLKWNPPKHSSLNSRLNSLSNSTLTIQEAREEDSGRWNCGLWRNTTMLTSAEIKLKIEQAPTDVWLLITICAAAVVFILILILTVILIRRHRKRVKPRRRVPKFCRCKDPKPKGFYTY
ncbi:CD4-1 molecule [Esox lucius]|uniref:Ig-like domain-containing protein n=1 Tax=Esox lucius TaxID=8010 RepID=A0A3P8YV79_ESOLU|nr:CD4-1 molecule [Esox lucius]